MVTELRVDAPGGAAEAYLAGEDGRPGVLFFMDAFGLRPRIAEMVERIAGWGYTVLAPNVFYREGSAADLAPRGDLRDPEERERFMATGPFERVRGYTPDLSGPDTEAWVEALAAHSGPGRIATTGYCMGARLALRTAGLLPESVAAVGGWHGGGLVTEAPDSPHLGIASSTAAYAFGHADQDRSMPAEAVTALGEALDRAGRPHVNEVYAGAAHGYTMADTAAYDEAAAERHFRTLRRLLDANLSG